MKISKIRNIILILLIILTYPIIYREVIVYVPNLMDDYNKKEYLFISAANGNLKNTQRIINTGFNTNKKFADSGKVCNGVFYKHHTFWEGTWSQSYIGNYLSFYLGGFGAFPAYFIDSKLKDLKVIFPKAEDCIDINSKDKVLDVAIKENHKNIVKYLLDNKLVKVNGNDLLDKLAELENSDIASLVLDYGNIKFDVLKKRGYSVSSAVSNKLSLDIIKKMIDKGLSPLANNLNNKHFQKVYIPIERFSFDDSSYNLQVMKLFAKNITLEELDNYYGKNYMSFINPDNIKLIEVMKKDNIKTRIFDKDIIVNLYAEYLKNKLPNNPIIIKNFKDKDVNYECIMNTERKIAVFKRDKIENRSDYRSLSKNIKIITRCNDVMLGKSYGESFVKFISLDGMNFKRFVGKIKIPAKLYGDKSIINAYIKYVDNGNPYKKILIKPLDKQPYDCIINTKGNLGVFNRLDTLGQTSPTRHRTYKDLYVNQCSIKIFKLYYGEEFAKFIDMKHFSDFIRVSLDLNTAVWGSTNIVKQYVGYLRELYTFNPTKIEKIYSKPYECIENIHDEIAVFKLNKIKQEEPYRTRFKNEDLENKCKFTL